MRVALIHDWLTGMRGGERVLECLCRLYPDATVHTLIWKRGSVSRVIESHPIRVSPLDRVPTAGRHYRVLLPLFPWAVESFDLAGFDLVISISHGVAKSVLVPEGVFHLSYVLTPMRYIWDLEAQYFPPGRYPWPLEWYVRSTCARLRRWDVATAWRAHAMIACSAHVARRIERHWGRTAEVIYPFIDLERFEPREGARDYYLLAGAFAPYKRGDLAIEACRRIGARLVVAGSGPQEQALRRLAGRAVDFVGWVSDDQLSELYSGAQALLFPGEEDFGLMPLEAMAAGCPVVAYGRGGALETVGAGVCSDDLGRLERGEPIRAPGGVLFGRQTPEALVEAMRLLDQHRPPPGRLREQALPFSAQRFEGEFRSALAREQAAWSDRRPGSPDR